MKVMKIKFSRMLIFLFIVAGILAIHVVGSYAVAENHPVNQIEANYSVINNHYQDGSVVINYPQISGLPNQSTQNFINDLLKSEAFKAIKVYSGTDEEYSIELNYDIHLATERLLSIEYIGLRYVANTAYPNNIFYTVNIDIDQAKRLKLTDVVNVKDELIQNINYNSYLEHSSDIKYDDINAEVINSNVFYNLENSDLYLNDAISGVSSYLTEDSLGISFPVSHALGDHVEFEIPYKQICSLITDNYKEVLCPDFHIQQISVLVNDKELVFDVVPMLENDRVLVPLRSISEALGAEVGWDEAAQAVSVKSNNAVISLQIGSNIIYKNGEEIALDVPVKIVNDRTIVPIRAISEGLDARVDWNDATQTVSIWTDSV